MLDNGVQQELKELKERINQIESLLSKDEDELLRETRNDRTQTSRFRNEAEKSKELAENHLKTIQGILEDLQGVQESSGTHVKNLETNITSYGNKLSEFKKISTDLADKQKKMSDNLEYLEQVFEEHPELEEEIQSFETALEKSQNQLTKVNTLHSSSAQIKGDIQEIYYEIFGTTVTDEETGEERNVEGLKEKLEKSYKELSKKLKDEKDAIEAFHNGQVDEYNAHVEAMNETFSKNSDKWNSSYDSIKEKIESLLPDAMTAGLSHAYSQKIKSIKDENKLNIIMFFVGIIGMVCVSLIPFYVSHSSMQEGLSLEDAILRVPRLVIGILPLYLPVLWLALSSSKKMNLSKRLIEEYSHKEALSKTVEGLSKQINNIEDTDVSEGLKNQLLANLLEVSSENPGKLISDYNKSDHPVEEATERVPLLRKILKKPKTQTIVEEAIESSNGSQN